MPTQTSCRPTNVKWLGIPLILRLQGKALPRFYPSSRILSVIQVAGAEITVAPLQVLPKPLGFWSAIQKNHSRPLLILQQGLLPLTLHHKPHMVKVLVHKSTGALVLPQSSYPRPLTHEPTSEPPSASQIVQDLPNLDTVDSSMEGEMDVEELDKWNFPMEEADAFLTDEFASDVNRAADDEDFFNPWIGGLQFFSGCRLIFQFRV